MAARSTTSRSKTTKATPAKKTTTTKATTTKKAAVKKAAVKKATPAKAAPAPTVVEESKPVVAGPVLKRPELVDRVVAQTGMKKKDVKPVVDAMLEVMGAGLAKGEEMNLPPLGKITFNRVKELAKAKVMIVKVRQPHANAPSDKDPLAEAAE